MFGFWSKNLSGSFCFNSKYRFKNLKFKDKCTVNYLHKEFHGLDLDEFYDNGFEQKDITTVIKIIYLLTKNDNNGDLIGVCNDQNTMEICRKSGLGLVTINLKEISKFSPNCPSNSDLIEIQKNKFFPYSICDIHSNLNNQNIPICSKVKANFVADVLKKYINHD